MVLIIIFTLIFCEFYLQYGQNILMTEIYKNLRQAIWGMNMIGEALTNSTAHDLKS